jgi:hypothetical protein
MFIAHNYSQFSLCIPETAEVFNQSINVRNKDGLPMESNKEYC